jgi:hypothetical protein
MAFTYDLFISYKSEDRPWASRFYEDIRRSFPLLKVFWDRTGIAPGPAFRPVLDEAIHASAHCVVFWSDTAAASGEVLDEVKGFQAHAKLQPDAEKGQRTLFYVPLQDKHSPLENAQGFADFRNLKVYDAAKPGRGTERLSEPAVAVEWQRMLRQIGDACLASYATQPVTLAILAMNTAIVGWLDNEYASVGAVPGPTLKDVLLKLDSATPRPPGIDDDARAKQLLDCLKKRYGLTAFDWRPFGAQETILDFMERLRVEANAKLAADLVRLLPDYRFHWVVKDLYAELTRPGITLEEYNRFLEDLPTNPSVVVVDQLSLYNSRIYTVFVRLNEYAKKEQGAIITLSPEYVAAADVAMDTIVGLGDAVLRGFFEPQIPGAGAFARCAVNVQHTFEAKRVIRSSLGLFYLQQKLKQGDPVTKG